MEVYISNRQNLKLNLKFIKNFVLKVLEEIEETKNKEVELSIVLVDNKKIREINKKFRKVDAPTDVIAFPQDFSEGEINSSCIPLVLGDIVISVEMAKKQARDYKIPFEKEILNLLIHGILHLLGYEDNTKIKREKMLKKQEEILKKIYFK
jgi:probable rRNA maturation factor